MLFHDDELVHIQSKALDILLLLVAGNGRLVTKDELVRALWGNEPVTEGTLAQYVFVLRRLLAEKPVDNNYIVTVHGKGYRFVAPVQVRESIAQTISQEEAASLGDVLMGERFSAFRLYCEGQHCLERRDEPGLVRALELFQKALQIEPSYAPAYIGIAQAQCLLAEYLFRAPFEVFPKAKDAIIRALQLDRSSADAHAVLGEILVFGDRDWSGAQRALNLAARLNPNSVLTRHWRAWFFTWTGHPEYALREIEQALKTAPASLLLLTTLGFVLISGGFAERAIDHLTAILHQDPGSQLAEYYLALAFIVHGDPTSAIKLLRNRNRSDHRQQRIALLGYAYAAADKERMALEMLAEIDGIGDSRYLAQYSRAIVYAGLDMAEKAIDALESACADGEAWLAFLRSDPLFAKLQPIPRFRALVERVSYSSALL